MSVIMHRLNASGGGLEGGEMPGQGRHPRFYKVSGLSEAFMGYQFIRENFHGLQGDTMCRPEGPVCWFVDPCSRSAQ